MLDGIWQPVSGELRGQSLPEGSLNHLKLILGDGNYELIVGTTTADRGIYEIIPQTSPQQMQITGTEGPNKGRAIPAIFELEEEKLTICYDLSGEKAPDDFKTNADSELYLVSYQRQSY
jgi:uncharacterized protein (TIGR03067 family)